MKTLKQVIIEERGDSISINYLNNDGQCITADGRDVMITDIDREKIPNEVIGVVNDNGLVLTYKWNEYGICLQASDSLGNPRPATDGDKLVTAS